MPESGVRDEVFRNCDGELQICFRLVMSLRTRPRRAIRPAGNKFYVNLKELNALWLERAGLHRIDISCDCTACQPQRFWSHRRVGNARGSLAAVIMLPEGEAQE